MGKNSYFADGQWNFICDLCGRKQKSGQSKLTWDGFEVCLCHKEVRNPQDFVRGVKDSPTPPWTRPQPPDSFVISTFRLLQESGDALLQEADSFGDTYYILR